jgi:diguanylate cyclase (GGDEF)-like protein
MLALMLVSVGAVACAFGISIYYAEVSSRSRGSLIVVAAYVIVCIALYRGYRQDVRLQLSDAGPAETEIDAHLKILDQAKEFFAGSLKTPDTFRLLVSRIDELITPDGVSLLLFDDTRSHLNVVQNDGVAYEKGSKIALDAGAVGRCLEERDVVIDEISRTAAIPLKRDAEIFSILVLHLAETAGSVHVDASLLDAIGERSAPLILASIACERSQENALTDATTDLPNERAFHLVLENQVAEAIRKGSSRPLTILCLDLENFDLINSRFGHAAGDRVLNFVAQRVKDSLRQMDFLASGMADEFLAIMPTASKEISHEVVARIQTSLLGTKIKVSDVDAVELELNFGWASFGVDGETPSSLIAVARERKEQTRSSAQGSVLWFPHESAH